jgi:hypothetical protein
MLVSFKQIEVKTNIGNVNQHHAPTGSPVITQSVRVCVQQCASSLLQMCVLTSECAGTLF